MDRCEKKHSRGANTTSASAAHASAAWKLMLLVLLALLFSACTSASSAQSPTVTGAVLPTTAVGATGTSALTATMSVPATSAPSETPAAIENIPPTTAAPTTSAQAALPTPPVPFNGERAYADVVYQVSLGPRIPGSQAHSQVIDWMKGELEKNGWTVEIQETTVDQKPVRNVIAKRGTGSPWRIIGAHFDSRMKADQDPDPAKQDQPVPAANDGASGVAVLLELARVAPKDAPGTVWLAFFDAEDQGDLPGWDWILGSRALANSLTSKPDAVVVIDMIGDANLNIYQERNSDPQLTQQIWGIAAKLGYGQQFISQPKYSMLDDHTPFLEKGMRAIDIIDFDYPYWHTTEDTADKVSAHSLTAVGDTLLHWLLQE